MGSNLRSTGLITNCEHWGGWQSGQSTHQGLWAIPAFSYTSCRHTWGEFTPPLQSVLCSDCSSCWGLLSARHLMHELTIQLHVLSRTVSDLYATSWLFHIVTSKYWILSGLELSRKTSEGGSWDAVQCWGARSTCRGLGILPSLLSPHSTFRHYQQPCHSLSQNCWGLLGLLLVTRMGHWIPMCWVSRDKLVSKSRQV